MSLLMLHLNALNIVSLLTQENAAGACNMFIKMLMFHLVSNFLLHRKENY